MKNKKDKLLFAFDDIIDVVINTIGYNHYCYYNLGVCKSVVREVFNPLKGNLKNSKLKCNYFLMPQYSDDNYSDLVNGIKTIYDSNPEDGSLASGEEVVTMLIDSILTDEGKAQMQDYATYSKHEDLLRKVYNCPKKKGFLGKVKKIG